MAEHTIEQSDITLGFSHPSTQERAKSPEPITKVSSVAYHFADANHPYEDSSYVGERPVFVVTDGVSRTKLPDGSYPDPSGAALAAETFANVTGGYLEARYTLQFPDTIFQAVQSGSDAVAALNEKHGIPEKVDYLVNDYFNTCAAVASITDGTVHYATIGDCQVAVFDKDDTLIMITENDVAPLEQERESKTFASKEERWLYWRQQLRNHPRAEHKTYGTITGEVDAEDYVKEGRQQLQNGDSVYLFSDGFFPFIMNKAFREFLKTNPTQEQMRAFLDEQMANGAVKAPKDDRTLIAVSVD